MQAHDDCVWEVLSPSNVTLEAPCYPEPQLPLMASSISDGSKELTEKDGSAHFHNLNLALCLFVDHEP